MRRRLLALLMLVAAAAAVAAILILGSSDAPPPGRAAIDAYLAAWERGDDAAAGRATNRPAEATQALVASRRGLDGAAVATRVETLGEQTDGRMRAEVSVRWRVPRFGPFAYRVELLAVSTPAGWRVRWRPRSLHPRLDADTRLGTAVQRARRGEIRDRDGRPLMTDRAVVDVAVEVDRMRSAASAASALEALLDVDGDGLRRTLARAPRGRFVPVITLRRADFAEVDQELRAIAGVSLAEDRAVLAPTRSFARATLGTVGPVTAEQVEASGGTLAPGDEVGQGGLQAAFEDRLAGRAARQVVLRGRASGIERAVLARRPGRPGRGIATTLDRDVQAAAESALADVDGNAALVAVQPSSGDVLAVANRPAGSSYDRALLGRYPPGSTFKIVSTAALLRAGLDPDEVVPCPPTRVVGGRSFRNFEGSARGDVPFAESFAQSCNTAFVGLAERLGRDEPQATARRFGFERELRPGVPAATARAPVGRDAVARAATMIGQDRILASPLTMAGVAATVLDGRWRAPRLLASAARDAGPPLPAEEVDTLRTLMRRVITEGTGSALAGVSGEPIGKSGTAEYGGGDPPPTHAWFVAARDDLALAVLVEGGRSGGEVAAPLAARFFAALDG